MKLLLDVGNSRVKWAWLAEGRWRDAGAAIHRDRPLEQVVADLRRQSTHAPRQIIVASVVDAGLTARVVDAFARGTPAEVVAAASEAAALGVRSGYHEPSQLGVDRWLGLVAARAWIGAAACVVQAGTAVTIDVLAPDGQHEGGLIAPGLELMSAALVGGTERLGAAAGEAEAGPAANGLALDTATAIRLGPLAALRALIQHCADEAKRRHGSVTVVITGGSAPALLEGWGLPLVHRPMLVLEGLALRHAGVRDLAALAPAAGY